MRLVRQSSTVYLCGRAEIRLVRGEWLVQGLGRFGTLAAAARALSEALISASASQ